MGKKMKIFAPSPDLAYNCNLSAWWDNGFTSEELDSICEMGERQPPQISMVGSGSGIVNNEIRTSIISWIDAQGWIADRLEFIANQLNGKYFGLDLWGFAEKLQYSVYKYNKQSKGHYTWHMDQGPNTLSPRKLSLVVQLSDPSEYEGGNLEFFTGLDEPEVAQKQRGIVYAFPSYVMHRVSPVTRGTRRSLVVWISGPRFK